MKILVTGVAGFIGMHLVKALVANKHEVVGIDNITDINYEKSLKIARLKSLKLKNTECMIDGQSTQSEYLTFVKGDLGYADLIRNQIVNGNFDVIIHLAALAGVRLSTSIPRQYLHSNVDGFFNVLEALRELSELAQEQEKEDGQAKVKIPHLIFASSSSVYGDCENIPFKEDDYNLNQKSVYAATKKMDETLAYTYASLFNLDIIGLRFFTVYGPYSRPDMAAILFTKAILQDKEIALFNEGKLSRDFTFVGDIVKGICLIAENQKQESLIKKEQQQAQEALEQGKAPVKFNIYNIGSGNPIELFDFVSTLEEVIGKKAKIRLEKMQKGDVYQTYADVSKLTNDYGFKPQTSLKDGLKAFYDWYADYYSAKD